MTVLFTSNHIFREGLKKMWDKAVCYVGHAFTVAFSIMMLSDLDDRMVINYSVYCDS